MRMVCLQTLCQEYSRVGSRLVESILVVRGGMYMDERWERSEHFSDAVCGASHKHVSRNGRNSSTNQSSSRIWESRLFRSNLTHVSKEVPSKISDLTEFSIWMRTPPPPPNLKNLFEPPQPPGCDNNITLSIAQLIRGGICPVLTYRFPVSKMRETKMKGTFISNSYCRPRHPSPPTTN